LTHATGAILTAIEIIIRYRQLQITTMTTGSLLNERRETAEP